MTIEELKRAYANGETIQFKLDGKGWTDWKNPKFDCEVEDYRIKPKYRPFKDIDELIATWQKMMGYPAKANTMPLIWVRHKYNENVSVFISGFDKTDNNIKIGIDWHKLGDVFDIMTFLDGEPFGVAE